MNEAESIVTRAEVKRNLLSLSLQHLAVCSLVLSLALTASRAAEGTNSSSAATSTKDAIQTAGELIVSLDARDSSAGDAVWTNKGSMGNFTRVGNPKLAKASGQPGVQFNGTSDAYRSEKPTPATITGAHARSIEVWVHNPSLDSAEESMVAWGHRGTPLANMAFSYGSGGGFSAATHYDQDMGWGDESPAENQWHHLAYTNDGKTSRIYDNGVERGAQEFTLATAADDRMNIAAQNSAEGHALFQCEFDSPWALSLSGFIGAVRVHSGALTADQVKANFNADKARFGVR